MNRVSKQDNPWRPIWAGFLIGALLSLGMMAAVILGKSKAGWCQNIVVVIMGVYVMAGLLRRSFFRKIGLKRSAMIIIGQMFSLYFGYWSGIGIVFVMAMLLSPPVFI